ncbi:MAG: ABC transporter ATP-binding protein [Desulfobacula sp.]|jgi:peptide/nickel transport system ATP-binding protein|nr:ABC transporter ATP-binding protein [Desulfobacula sp.]
MKKEDPLLEVSKLTLDYRLGKRKMRALDRVSFQLEKGEIMGVAGESGCGKSTLGLAIIKLLPKIAEITRGEILFEGQDLLKFSENEMNQKIRGQKISMIFQNPQHALNPVFTIEKQMTDILRVQEKYKNKRKRPHRYFREQATERLTSTGIADPAARLSNYPFEFSGGMKQRVMIGMALSSGTSLLLADEATTALDVTIEAQINRLISDLAAEYGTSVLYISHNLGVLAELADRIMIMYAGRIFEMGTTADVFDSPSHPYSAALLESLPSRQARGKRLLSIPGFVPPLDQLPEGCSFHPRCRFVEDICTREVPPFEEVTDGHWSACFLDKKRGRKRWQWI